jgi:hypothetical protein
MEVALQQDEEKANLALRKAPKKDDDGRAAIVSERDHQAGCARKRIERLKAQCGKVHGVLRNNYRKQLNAGAQSGRARVSGLAAPSATTSGVVQAKRMSPEAFARQQQAIKHVYPHKTPAAPLPAVIDYGAQLHEVFSAADDDSSVYAAIALKQWQALRSTGLVERLSVAYLKDTLARRYPDLVGSNALSTAEVLEVMRTDGCLPESKYDLFRQRDDQDTIKARARILATALNFGIDGVMRIADVQQAKLVLQERGVFLLTLPDHGDQAVSAEQFWKRKDGGGAPAGYQNVLVYRCDDHKQQLHYQHCVGQEFGLLGRAPIAYQDLDPAHTMMLVVLSGKRGANAPL